MLDFSYNSIFSKNYLIFAILLNSFLIVDLKRAIMENWILLGVLSPLFYALVNVLDKFVLGKRIKNVYAFGAMMGFFYFLIAGAVIYAVGVPSLSLFQLLFISFLGLLSGTIHLLFFRIMRHNEISRVVGIMYAYPIFVALISVLVLGESIPLTKYIGVGLAAVGALLLATQKHHLKWHLCSIFWDVAFIAVLLAVIDVSDKYILQFVRPLEFYPVYLSVSALMLVAPLVRRRVRVEVVRHLSSAPLVGLIAVVGFGGTMTFLMAASEGPIAIVSSLATLQPLFVLVMALLLSVFLPRFLKETWNHDPMLHKLLGVLCIIAGVVVLVV